MDCSPPDSFVHGILQARILQWVAVLSSRGSSQSRDETHVFYTAGRFFTSEPLGKPQIGNIMEFKVLKPPSQPLPYHEMRVAQLCPTLGNPMDHRVHGILHARILEWVAFPFSRGSSQPRDRTQVSCITGKFFTSWATREATWTPPPWTYTNKAIHHSAITNLDVNTQRPRKPDVHQYTTAQQPRCPSTSEQLRKGLVHYVQWNITQPLKGTNVNPLNWGGWTQSLLYRWNKSERKRQISYTNTHIWNLEKWYWWNYLQDTHRDTDIEKRLVNTAGDEKYGTNWECSIDIYILPYVK